MTATMRNSMPGAVVSLALGIAAGGAGAADLFVAGTLGEVYVADTHVGQFELFGGICLAEIHSLAIDDASVFAGDLNGGILRLDLATGNFMEVYFVVGDATDLVVHNGDLLVSTSFSEIHRVEPVGGAHIQTLASPITVQAMAIDGDDLYIAGTIGTVYKGNAITGDFQFLGGTCLAPVQALALDETSIYAGDATGAILIFDLTTGANTGAFDLGLSVTSIVMDGPELLVGTFGGSIFRLDPDSGAVLDTLTSPVFVSAMELVPAAADLDGDGAVGIVDFLALLAAWGPCPGACPPSCNADLDGDCIVGITDFLILLGAWG